MLGITLRLSNMAMEDALFIGDSPIETANSRGFSNWQFAMFDYSNRISPWSTFVVIVAVVTIFGCLVEGIALQILAPNEGVGRSNPKWFKQFSSVFLRNRVDQM